MFSEDMGALRDAYFDSRDILAPFVSPWTNDFFEGLSEEDAQEEHELLYDDLIEDGYTCREIRFLSALAICDIRNEMREDIENYETEA
ncbi:MAG TPA: hypothetical protein VM535_01200 [Candidatus Saccharimonadales bacterium]|nr:hypothetical protein [Candidatus Saccharimonadales bacterium]